MHSQGSMFTSYIKCMFDTLYDIVTEQCMHILLALGTTWAIGMCQAWSCMITHSCKMYHAGLHPWQVRMLSPFFGLCFRVLLASHQDGSNLLTKLFVQLSSSKPLPLSQTFLTCGLGSRKVDLGLFPVTRSTKPTLEENWVEIGSSNEAVDVSSQQVPTMFENRKMIHW